MNIRIRILLIAFACACALALADSVTIILGTTSTVTWQGSGNTYVATWGPTATPTPPPVSTNLWNLYITTVTNGAFYTVTPSVSAGKSNLWVSYSDGTTSNVTTAVAVKHYFATSGSYTISMSGTVAKCILDSAAPQNTYLKRYDPLGGFTNLNQVGVQGEFYNMTALTNIPDGSFDSVTNITSWGGSAAGNGAFEDAAVTSIPSALFNFTDSASTFGRMFWGTPITSIPTNLIDRHTNAAVLYGMFSECPIATAPESFFAKLQNSWDYRYAFLNCTSLTGCPASAFSSTGAVQATGIFQGSGIRALADNQFAGWTQAITFFQACYAAQSLTGLGTNLFNTSQAVSFGGTFAGITNKLFRPTAGLFSACTGATAFGSTVGNSGVFEGSTGITSPLPAGIYSANRAVTTFERAHLGTRMPSITAGQYDGNPLVTSFKYCHYQNYSMTSVPAGLHTNNLLVTTYYGEFESCTNAWALPADLVAASNAVIANVARMFYNNAKMTGNAIRFWDHTNYPTIAGAASAARTQCYFNCVSLSDYSQIPISFGGTNGVVDQ